MNLNKNNKTRKYELIKDNNILFQLACDDGKGEKYKKEAAVSLRSVPSDAVMWYSCYC